MWSVSSDKSHGSGHDTSLLRLRGNRDETGLNDRRPLRVLERGDAVCGGFVIRVLIAEDMHMIRGALVALLRLEPDIDVIAELDRGDAIVETALKTRPDVAVIDIDLPGLDGLSAAASLRDKLPSCQTLVLTGLSQPGNLLRALKVHVKGFLLKDAPAPALANAIRSVASGRRVLDPELVA